MYRPAKFKKILLIRDRSGIIKFAKKQLSDKLMIQQNNEDNAVKFTKFTTQTTLRLS